MTVHEKYPAGSVWINPNCNAIVMVVDPNRNEYWNPITFLFLDPGNWGPVSHNEWYSSVFDECERIA